MRHTKMVIIAVMVVLLMSYGMSWASFFKSSTSVVTGRRRHQGRLDRCPDSPEDFDRFEDEDGCPEPDNDKDGLADAQDKCPIEAEDADNFQDDDGCPDPDNDGDGVADGQDQCPDQMETKNGFQHGDGCADEVPKAIKKFTGVIKGINFKSDSDEILKSSFVTLDAAAKVLTDYPDLKMEIHGHTDDQAEDQYNMELSQRRADAVKAYFVGKGVDESRPLAKGYGETAPLVNKKTKAARAKNRRVEFKLISDGGPPRPPVGTVIEAGQRFEKDLASVLSLDPGRIWQGALIIESDVAGLVVDLTESSGPLELSRAALPVSQSLARALVIPYAARNDTLATSIALFNPNGSPAYAQLRMFAPDGTQIDASSIALPSFGRIARLLSELFPKAGSPVSGYVLIDADQPICGAGWMDRAPLGDGFAVAAEPSPDAG